VTVAEPVVVSIDAGVISMETNVGTAAVGAVGAVTSIVPELKGSGVE
jgi:hypothetical protein